jgi:hypothetical protein
MCRKTYYVTLKQVVPITITIDAWKICHKEKWGLVRIRKHLMSSISASEQDEFLHIRMENVVCTAFQKATGHDGTVYWDTHIWTMQNKIEHADCNHAVWLEQMTKFLVAEKENAASCIKGTMMHLFVLGTLEQVKFDLNYKFWCWQVFLLPISKWYQDLGLGSGSGD